jgi:hypothetical protein
MESHGSNEIIFVKINYQGEGEFIVDAQHLVSVEIDTA